MTLDFEPDFRQKIANQWPASINDEDSFTDWDWKYDISTFQMAQKILDGIAPEYKSEFSSEELATSDENLTSDEETTTTEGTTSTTRKTPAFFSKIVNMQ